MKLKMYAGDVLSIYIMTYNTCFVFQTKKLETALAPLTDDKTISCSTPR